MRTNKFLAIVIFLTSVMLISCNKDDSVTNDLYDKQDVNFAIKSKEIMKGVMDNSIDDAVRVVITIEDNEGVSTNYDLEIYHMNDSYFTQKIAFITGSYTLTMFQLFDNQDDVIFICPLEGSPQSQNVDNPLPIDFEVTTDEVTSITIEVISTENLTPADFGFTQFIINEVQTFNFLVSVFELGINTNLITADITVTSGVYTLSSNLTATINSVVIKDGYEEYTLFVTKTGYQSYQQIFTVTELKNYEDTPLSIELEIE